MTDLLIGAHCSIAGGVWKALLIGQEIGATTIQLFTANQKQWKGKAISKADVEMWKETLKETGMKKVMSHAGYLINLGSPRPDIHQKSLVGFRDEIERCLDLELSYLNFHPGAALHSSEEECLEQIIESLLTYEKLLDGSDLTLLLETTAGQGTTVGWRFEQLGTIIEGVKHAIPIGVCIDTCHIFAAGYDIRTKKGWDSVLDEFDREVGLKYLKAFHVNDSMKELASRRDRHEHLGKGEIGMTCFKTMMTHPKMKRLPKYLETPSGPPVWVDEIAMLRKFAGAS